MATEDQHKAEVGDDLKARISSLVDALVAKDSERYEADFVLLLTRVQDLVDRKRRMEGSKTDTRDLLAELLFSRMRRGMQLFLQSEDTVKPHRAAEWVMGALFSITTLSEFAQAFDRVLVASHSQNHDFNFAGRTDFISVEEVLQMLSAGKHVGCLSLETADNRLDVYLKEGRIVFLDPHRMIRRVIPAADAMRHREIPENAVTKAEGARTASGRPVLLGLFDDGFFRKDELREAMALFSKEVLFDFMRERDAYVFYYRRLDTLPDFAIEHDMRLGVTSMLLEGSKRVDDWRQLLTVFPNLDEPLEPRADMFARMGDVALGVLEIKLIGLINGEITPRSLAPALGLPLHDVYQLLVRLARDGIIVAPAGERALAGVNLSVEESMQEAFAALEANDDKHARRSALDKVLGDAAPLPAGGRRHSALDRVFGGGGADADEPAAGPTASPLEKDLLSFLKKPPRR